MRPWHENLLFAIAVGCLPPVCCLFYWWSEGAIGGWFAPLLISAICISIPVTLLFTGIREGFRDSADAESDSA
ncbi:MAG: hypothetical protein AAF842_08505 [Planctomycetota bacterium]